MFDELEAGRLLDFYRQISEFLFRKTLGVISRDIIFYAPQMNHEYRRKKDN